MIKLHIKQTTRFGLLYYIKFQTTCRFYTA